MSRLFAIVSFSLIFLQNANAAERSYLHEGAFCSGDWWELKTGKDGPINPSNRASSIYLALPNTKGGQAIGLFDGLKGNTEEHQFRYAWVKVEPGHDRICISLRNEGPNTPARTWISRGDHRIWFSDGVGLDGKLSYMKYRDWETDHSDDPPEGVNAASLQADTIEHPPEGGEGPIKY